MVKQSLFLAILLSSLNGFFCVLANFCLSYPDYLAKKGRQPWPGYKTSYGVLANFALQTLSEVGSVATWFGPVALTVPVGLGSMLLFNMFFYGFLVPIDHFSRDMRVGTLIIVIAVVLLPVDGPQAQDNQDILVLLSTPLAIAWSAIMLGLLFYSTFFLMFFRGDLKKVSNLEGSLILIIALFSGCVVQNTTAKMFVFLQGWPLVIAIALWFVCSMSLAISPMVAAVAVDQSKFIPVGKYLSSVCTIRDINSLLLCVRAPYNT